jgi:hypothetical protein
VIDEDKSWDAKRETEKRISRIGYEKRAGEGS